MLGWTRSQVQPIGLDIGRDSVKMLQLQVRGNSLAVVAAARRSLEAPCATPRDPAQLITPEAKETIVELLRGGDFQGRSVIAALPRQMVQVKNLRLPQMPAAELASVVRFESANIFGFEDDEARIDYLPAGEVRQGADIRQEVIVLAARRADIDRYLESLHRVGLLVDGLDVEPCALYRGIERFVRRREDEQEVHVLIDVGMHRSQVLIGKGRDISFFKTIDVGGIMFNEAVSKKLAITVEEARALRRRLAVSAADPEAARRDPVRQAVLDAARSTMEDLAREISLCLRYYSVTFRGHRPTKVRLLGGEAYDPQLLAILNAVLSAPVEIGRPLFSVDCTSIKGLAVKEHTAEWALAFGLGLKRAEGRFAPMDGTPRGVGAAAPTAEVVDLNAAIAPPAGKENPAQQEHFAAVRRATVAEPAHA